MAPRDTRVKDMKLLCISGSPIPGGNTRDYIDLAVEPLAQSDIDVEIVELADLDVADCNHCNWCLRNEDPARICKQEDDAGPVLARIRESDVLVLASPAYYGRMTGRMSALLDRTRPFLFARPHRGCMRDKPGLALTVGWGRNAGVETTLLSTVLSFMTLEMIPVAHHHTGVMLGAVGLANPGLVGTDMKDRHSVRSDETGIKAARAAVKRAVDLAGRIQRSTVAP